MTFVGKELGVLGEQHKLKQRGSMTHLVLSFYCCGATEGSEQQHSQDLKEIYKG